MSEEPRPAIPAELRRKVLVEAGHRCAIPTCRHIDVDIHHIIPWEQCKEHSYENLIAFCPNCHRRAGNGGIDRMSQRIYKANLRRAHEVFSQFEVDFLFALYKALQGASAEGGTKSGGVPFPEYLKPLVMRLDDSKFLTWGKKNPKGGGISMLGMDLLPTMLWISEEGQRYIHSLSSNEGEEDD